MPAVLIRKLQAIRRLSAFSIFWLPFILVTLGFARAAILALTFKRLSPVLGTKLDSLSATTKISARQYKRAVQISKAVQMVARNVPWVANCFPQAIAARILLGVYRIPYVLFFGLRRDRRTQELLAHAWVVSGELVVTGSMAEETFTPVALYSNHFPKAD